MVVHEAGRAVGGKPDDRGDRQIDVAGEHHQHLRRPRRSSEARRPSPSAVRFAPPSMRGLIKVTGMTTAAMAADQADLALRERRGGAEEAGAGARRPAARLVATAVLDRGAPASASVAARMTLSCVASLRTKLGRDRAPRAGRRCDRTCRCSSGSSDEIRMIASPCAASSAIIAWTSALVWTSTPWVGSSRISSRGSAASHLASTTFCWLPPESVLTGWS